MEDGGAGADIGADDPDIFGAAAPDGEEGAGLTFKGGAPGGGLAGLAGLAGEGEDAGGEHGGEAEAEHGRHDSGQIGGATEGSPRSSPFGSVGNPIRMMEREHEEVGREMRLIRELTGDFTPPEDGCTTYRVCFSELLRFESDLHRHVHLENNVLFPKVLALEEQVCRG